jgi:hypothetical protein
LKPRRGFSSRDKTCKQLGCKFRRRAKGWARGFERKLRPIVFERQPREPVGLPAIVWLGIALVVVFVLYMVFGRSDHYAF